MPHKAFLHKKSLLDQFKDDHKHTGLIQSMRAEHTWNNPLTRRKLTKELNGWIKSFAGKRHVHKLARFNAQQAGRNESYDDVKLDCLRYADILELPNGVCVKVNATIRCPRRAAFVFRITGIYDAEPENPSKYVIRGFYPVYGLECKPSEEFDIPCNDVSGIEQWVKSNEKGNHMQNEAMSLKGFIENLSNKLVNKYGLEKDVVKNYLNLHTEEMQELLDNKELSLKEKVLFVRSEITGEQDKAKQSESLVLPNPTIIYRGTSEDAKKASHYISNILADKGLGWGRVGWSGPKNGEFHYGHPEKDVYTVCLRGSNDLIKDSFAVYKDVFGNDFWNNCDADPQGWVNPLTINKYDVATPRQESKKYEGFNTTRDLDNFALHILNYIKDKTHYPGYVRFVKLNDNEEDFYGKYVLSVNGKNYYLYVGDTDYSITDNNDENTLVEGSTDLSGAMNNVLLPFCERIQQSFYTESKKPADEKLGYEKGHKNSKGEDAPWVIRSHEDNRILASFAKKKDAEEHMQRMKQYSKDESKKSESATTEEDAIRKAFKSIVDHVPANEKSNFGEEFVNENMEALLDLFNAWFVFEDGEFVTTVKVVDPDNENGDCYDADDEAYQWNACYNVTEGIIDLLGWNYGEETVKQPIQDALFYDFIGTKYIDNSNESKNLKKSEASDLEGYTSDVISELDTVWGCGEDGATRIAKKYADVIQQNYVDGDLLASETAKFIAGQEHLTESRKKSESKKSEVHLELIETIVVPKWLWDAFYFADEYGETLNEEEEEILADFKAKYADAKYHLETPEEEADFRSRNDFDEYGGPCYEIRVFKEK